MQPFSATRLACYGKWAFHPPNPGTMNMGDTPRTSPHNVPEFEHRPGSGSAWAATRDPSLLPPAGSSAARDVSHKVIETTSPKSSSVMAGAENSRQKTVWVVLKR